MELENQLKNIVKIIIKKKFKILIDNLIFQPTRKEFEGDITLLLFPLLKKIKTDPETLGKEIGSNLKSDSKKIKKSKDK